MQNALGNPEEFGMFGSQMPQDDDEDDEEEDEGKTATFPFLNRLFGSGNEAPTPPRREGENPSKEGKKEGQPKRKFLDSYCINLSRRAQEGKLDSIVGREEEIQRVIQILNRRQKNNPCLIGEPGVGSADPQRRCAIQTAG
jgi:ATP-dependent Clp protease ATP-binding subunit ClpB